MCIACPGLPPVLSRYLSPFSLSLFHISLSKVRDTRVCVFVTFFETIHHPISEHRTIGTRDIERDDDQSSKQFFEGRTKNKYDYVCTIYCFPHLRIERSIDVTMHKVARIISHSISGKWEDGQPGERPSEVIRPKRKGSVEATKGQLIYFSSASTYYSVFLPLSIRHRPFPSYTDNG